MKNIILSAAVAVSMMAFSSAAFANDGRTDPNPHTGTGRTSTGTSTKYYPSCHQTPKPSGCGGRSTSSTGGTTTGTTGKYYPSCHQSPKPSGCGGR